MKNVNDVQTMKELSISDPEDNSEAKFTSKPSPTRNNVRTNLPFSPKKKIMC
jgi:hypothetical protein